MKRYKAQYYAKIVNDALILVLYAKNFNIQKETTSNEKDVD